jgi:tripartite-type tricarboxylate transporter receptor subunit TctC
MRRPSRPPGGWFRSLALAGLALVAALPAWAQSALQFRGKELRILVGYAAGGGYDIYARAVAQHLGRHIPGNPAVIVQNMPGADGFSVANSIYGQAAKDGTIIAVTNRNIAVAPILGLIDANDIRYDPRKFTWIANLNSEISVALFRSDAGARSIEDLKAKIFIVGATGLTSNNAVYPYIMNNLIGTKLKVVVGYPGTSDVTLALERGEIQGNGGWAWSSFMVQRPTWLRDKIVVPILLLSLQRVPELGDTVPSIFDYAHDAETRQALDLIFSPDTIGRPFFAPPGIPAAATAMLRTAFAALPNDPAFLATAEKTKLDLSFMGGEELQRLVDRIAAATPAAVALATRITQRGATAIETKAP